MAPIEGQGKMTTKLGSYTKDGKSNWFFVPLPWTFLGEIFCNTYSWWCYTRSVVNPLVFGFDTKTSLLKVALLASLFQPITPMVPPMTIGCKRRRFILLIGAFLFTTFSMVVPHTTKALGECNEPKNCLI